MIDAVSQVQNLGFKWSTSDSDIQSSGTQARYKFADFQSFCQYHFILLCFESNRKMKTFILIVACIGLSSAFELSELFSDRLLKPLFYLGRKHSFFCVDRTFCCAFINAKQQCHDTCSGQPCENTCEARSVMSSSPSLSMVGIAPQS